MKIPEKAPDWREILPEVFTLSSDTVDLLNKANKEYLYWDKLKHKPMPKGIKPEEAWAIVKTSRSANRKTPFLETINSEYFNYWIPSHAQQQLHLIDRGMEKVIAGALEGQTANEYQLNSIIEEAITSSQIEGAATTRPIAKEMLRTERKPKDHSEKMILNNFRTINKLKDFLDEPLSPKLIKEIQKSMTENTLEETAWAGEFRTEQNEVRDSDQKVLFTPPPHTEIEHRINLMCDFINADHEETFTHPVIKGIILHFWIAYVHPFMDGNGRTARALFYWYMLKHNYPNFEFLAISGVIKKKRTQYLKAFLYSEIDDNDMTYFIMFHLNAIEEALDDVVKYIKEKKQEKQSSMDFLKSYPSLNNRQLSLLANALEKPDETYTFDKHANVHGIVRQSARTDLLGLKDLGLMLMHKEGRKFVFTPAPGLDGMLRG